MLEMRADSWSVLNASQKTGSLKKHGVESKNCITIDSVFLGVYLWGATEILGGKEGEVLWMVIMCKIFQLDRKEPDTGVVNINSGFELFLKRYQLHQWMC